MARDARRKGFYAKKQFLNKPYFHLGAYIMSEVEMQMGDEWIDSYSRLRIADCNEVINLEVELSGSKAKYDNTLYKIDTLISNLQGLRAACVKARAFYLVEKEKIDKRRKEEEKKRKKEEKKNETGKAMTRIRQRTRRRS